MTDKTKLELIENAKEYVKNIFESDYSGHDVFHTLRVYRTATHIADTENADVFIAGLAALLHDVDDMKLSPETHKNKTRAVSFMHRNNLPDSIVCKIVSIIEEVSYSGVDSVSPGTLEGKCVQDADRLDALGAIGIARAFAYGGSRNRQMYNPEISPRMHMGKEVYHTHISTTVNHFYEKLFNLKNLMNTDTAKQIAEKREAYMKNFISEFLSEWNMMS